MKRLTGAMAGTLLAACASTAPTAVPGPPQAAAWQRHQATIHYYGLTAQYSCSGFEDKVRQLLLYLGARRDLTVHTTACTREFDRPGHEADVDATFYTLAPAGDAASGGPTAAWTPVSVRPTVPAFMGYGECELIRQIRSVIAQDYSSRNLNYRTTCTPYQVTLSDYSVSGEFLQPIQAR